MSEIETFLIVKYGSIEKALAEWRESDIISVKAVGFSDEESACLMAVFIKQSEDAAAAMPDPPSMTVLTS